MIFEMSSSSNSSLKFALHAKSVEESFTVRRATKTGDSIIAVEFPLELVIVSKFLI